MCNCSGHDSYFVFQNILWSIPRDMLISLRATLGSEVL